MGRQLGRSVAALLVAVAVVPGLQGCVSLEVSGGCSDRDRAFGSALDKLPILERRPAGAESAETHAGCDEDDGFAYAGRTYRASLTRDAIRVFYRREAAADGWHADGDNPPPTAGLVVSGAASCYSRQVDDTTAYLAVWFPDDLVVPGEPTPVTPYATFGIEVTASHDGAAWC